MATLTASALPGLLNGRRPPCVSIYLPTERRYPGSQQNPLRYKNLLHTVEQALRQRYPGHEVLALLDKLHAVAANGAFAAPRYDGLAVLGSPDAFHVFDLPR